MYKKFYEDVKLVKWLNYNDPSDFANEVLALLANFNEQEAVEQLLALGGGGRCAVCGREQINFFGCPELPCESHRK